MKILIIGGGNMGQSFAKSFLHNHIADISNFAVLEKDENKFEELKKIGIKHIHNESGSFIENFDLVVLAVKPQAFESLSKELKKYINNGQVVLSIMA